MPITHPHPDLNELLTMAQPQYPDCFGYHQAFGAIVSCLSVPDALTPSDILDLILEGEEEAAETFLAANPHIDQLWLTLLDEILESLNNDENYLQTLYPHDNTQPGESLAEWCDGYLQAYFYTENIWQEVFATINEAEDKDELSDLEENHGILLNIISSFSNWKEALIAQPLLADITEHMAELHADLFGGVQFYFSFGQEMASALESLGEQTEPYINPVTIGRNDPCICGSGKKYKKCCLN